jgi:hypothetical protein
VGAFGSLWKSLGASREQYRRWLQRASWGFWERMGASGGSWELHQLWEPWELQAPLGSYKQLRGAAGGFRELYEASERFRLDFVT